MHRFRSQRRKPELNAQINVTNLVDVALTILIMFMLIAPLIEHSFRVVLPKAEEKKITEPAQVKIEIARTKELFLGGMQVTRDELGTKLARYAANYPSLSVNIQGDAGISYQDLVDVLDVIREAGVTRVGLATEVKVPR